MPSGNISLNTPRSGSINDKSTTPCLVCFCVLPALLVIYFRTFSKIVIRINKSENTLAKRNYESPTSLPKYPRNAVMPYSRVKISLNTLYENEFSRSYVSDQFRPNVATM